MYDNVDIFTSQKEIKPLDLSYMADRTLYVWNYFLRAIPIIMIPIQCLN